MNALSIGAAGLASASARFAASAQRLVSGQGDLVAETAEQITDKEAFSASAAVVRTGDGMMKRLLDILA